MKISYRSKPVIEFIKAGTLDDATYYDNDYNDLIPVRNHLKYEWEENAHLFSNNIKVLTKPFLLAVEKAHDKLTDAILPKQSFGTFIFDKFAYCYAYDTFDYTHYDVVIFEFYGNDLIYYQSLNRENVLNKFISKTFKTEILGDTFNEITDSEFVRLKTDHLFSIINFIKYADIETKFLKASSKKKYEKIKYVNDTKYDVDIMDTTWFTESIRTDGFPVSGHFRFQPYGHDMQERKLIWIQDFQKHGYHRKPKMLNLETV